MNITHCGIDNYGKNSELPPMEKQSQTNPTCGEQGRTIHSVFIRVNSWLNSKQTQSKPILPASMAGKIALSEVEGPMEPIYARGQAIENS
jgi:hypothetical protein